jgi:outer membrane protein
MRYILFSIFTLLAINQKIAAQTKWNLKQCVEFAMANNIAIKQTDLQTQLSDLQLKQSRLSQLPNVNFSTGGSFNSGRNQDPTSFSLITQSYVAANAQLQTSADIFNFFSKKNTIAANEWSLQAAKANVDKLKNDLALSVANAYLQILLASEQQKIAGLQLQQSQAQLINTSKLVKAGSLPELNAAELEAQVARDSATFISAKGAVAQSTLSLKSLMSIDAANAFEVETPPVENIPVESIADLQPDAVYQLAIANLPQQRANDFKIKAAEKNTAATKAAMLPTFSGFGSLGTGFNSRAKEITGVNFINAPLGKVVVGGTNYDVFPLQPFANYAFSNTKLGKQVNENFRQSVGLSINVPIFNGSNLRSNYLRNKINVQSLLYQKDIDNQKLKQDIYQAYNNSMVALEKFNASKKSVSTAERSFSFAQKRYEVGLLSTLELVTNQNNLFRAKLEYALNQFDYVFKMKVLEFYKGQGLKL